MTSFKFKSQNASIENGVLKMGVDSIPVSEWKSVSIVPFSLVGEIFITGTLFGSAIESLWAGKPFSWILWGALGLSCIHWFWKSRGNYADLMLSTNNGRRILDTGNLKELEKTWLGVAGAIVLKT